MTLIDIKLKKDASRESLSTVSGYFITKDKYITVEDTDRDINTFLTYRNDLLIKEHSKKIKSSGKNKNEEVFAE